MCEEIFKRVYGLEGMAGVGQTVVPELVGSVGNVGGRQVFQREHV